LRPPDAFGAYEPTVLQMTAVLRMTVVLQMKAVLQMTAVSYPQRCSRDRNCVGAGRVVRCFSKEKHKRDQASVFKQFTALCNAKP
jgi:hypothetical protein